MYESIKLKAIYKIVKTKVFFVKINIKKTNINKTNKVIKN